MTKRLWQSFFQKYGEEGLNNLRCILLASKIVGVDFQLAYLDEVTSKLYLKFDKPNFSGKFLFVFKGHLCIVTGIDRLVRGCQVTTNTYISMDEHINGYSLEGKKNCLHCSKLYEPGFTGFFKWDVNLDNGYCCVSHAMLGPAKVKKCPSCERTKPAKVFFDQTYCSLWCRQFKHEHYRVKLFSVFSKEHEFERFSKEGNDEKLWDAALAYERICDVFWFGPDYDKPKGYVHKKLTVRTLFGGDWKVYNNKFNMFIYRPEKNIYKIKMKFPQPKKPKKVTWERKPYPLFEEKFPSNQVDLEEESPTIMHHFHQHKCFNCGYLYGHFHAHKTQEHPQFLYQCGNPKCFFYGTKSILLSQENVNETKFEHSDVMNVLTPKIAFVPFKLSESFPKEYKSKNFKEGEIEHSHANLATERFHLERFLHQKVLNGKPSYEMAGDATRISNYTEESHISVPQIQKGDIRRLEVARRKNNPFCKHVFEECECYRKYNICTSTHALYYMSETETTKMDHFDYMGHIVHLKFSKYLDNVEVEIENGKIKMKVEGNEDVYEHNHTYEILKRLSKFFEIIVLANMNDTYLLWFVSKRIKKNVNLKFMDYYDALLAKDFEEVTCFLEAIEVNEDDGYEDYKTYINYANFLQGIFSRIA
jgi:hypothetical protein